MLPREVRDGSASVFEAPLLAIIVGALWPIEVLAGFCQGGGGAVIDICGTRALLMTSGAFLCLALAIVTGMLGVWWLLSIALVAYVACGASAFYFSVQDGEMF